MFSTAFNKDRSKNKELQYFEKPIYGFDKSRLLKDWETPCNKIKEL